MGVSHLLASWIYYGFWPVTAAILYFAPPFFGPIWIPQLELDLVLVGLVLLGPTKKISLPHQIPPSRTLPSRLLSRSPSRRRLSAAPAEPQARPPPAAARPPPAEDRPTPPSPVVSLSLSVVHGGGASTRDPARGSIAWSKAPVMDGDGFDVWSSEEEEEYDGGSTSEDEIISMCRNNLVQSENLS
ncbi:uncharacterized protein LOC125518946 [Triticum urartu]|uniref:uncharacterized protein LOC125518946 n=1 Tax=Triticum urartu TaxID=4572 RepID=UPI002044078A|nr:uncharacterized protein LOC125518946 [Triticum urartu]